MNRIDYDYYKVYPEIENVYQKKIVVKDVYELQATIQWIRQQECYDGYIVIGHIIEYKQDEIVCRGNIERQKAKKKTRKN